MQFFKNVMPGQNSRFMLALICSKCYLKKNYYGTNFLLGGVTFKHKTPLLKSNYSTKNEFYRKRYAGTFMLFFYRKSYSILFQSFNFTFHLSYEHFWPAPTKICRNWWIWNFWIHYYGSFHDKFVLLDLENLAV